MRGQHSLGGGVCAGDTGGGRGGVTRPLTTSRWPLLTLVSASGVAPARGGSITRVIASPHGTSATSLQFARVADVAFTAAPSGDQSVLLKVATFSCASNECLSILLCTLSCTYWD